MTGKNIDKPQYPPTEIPKHIAVAVIAAAGDERRISCAEARRLAEDFAIGYDFMGYILDELEIHVSACGLGCF